MKVFFAATDKFPAEWSYAAQFTALAGRDQIGIHTLAGSAEEADLILFVDPQLPHRWTLDAIRAHPYLSQYPRKTFIYNERDHSWCILPGIYPSVLRSDYDPRRQRAYSYFRDYGEPLTRDAEGQAPDLLFSFMGAPTHKVRQPVLGLSHPRAYLEDTSHAKFYDYSAQRDEEGLRRQRELYADIMRRSKFILCPRGHGTSSFRIFETLRAGRVPVIISDEWTEPAGPDWSGCSLRIREAEVAGIPALLETQEPQFERMSRRAGQVYAEWFAPGVIFHQIIEKCEELMRAQPAPVIPNLLFDRQYLRCGLDEVTEHLRYKLNALRKRV